MKLKPTKPDKNATKKTLATYHSQLNKWHRALETWEKALNQFEEELQIEQMPPDFLLECGCTIYEAKEGCECSDCGLWRETTGYTEEEIMEMELCMFDDLFLNQEQKPTKKKPKPLLNTDEKKFFAPYEKQMKKVND